MIDPDRVEEFMSELEGPSAPREPDGSEAGGDSTFPEPRPSVSEEELGEEAELRRALSVVDELMDLRPDDLSLRARRIRYLERLGAEAERTTEVRELAECLAERGDERAARLLCRLIASRHPDDPRIRERLSSLGSPNVVPPPRPGKVRTNGKRNREAPLSDDQLQDLAWDELTARVEALPWLCRARRKLETDGESPAAYRDYARYLSMRGRVDEACELLSSLLATGAEDLSVEIDLRTDLVECLLQLGRRKEAREHLRELARRDDTFALVGAALE